MFDIIANYAVVVYGYIGVNNGVFTNANMVANKCAGHYYSTITNGRTITYIFIRSNKRFEVIYNGKICLKWLRTNK